MGIAKEWIGKRVGRLIVKELAGKAKDRHLIYRCACDCGGEVSVRTNSLRSGHTQSCGCLQKESRIKHGCARDFHATREYRSWMAMKSRCYNSKNIRYSHYGGRGIEVCDSWINSFENFYKDMGDCSQGMTLEREDNDGNYTLNNCRWATYSEQSNNTSRNKLATYNGETKNITQWAHYLGIHPTTLRTRLKRNWSDERTIATPVQVRRQR